MTKEHRENVKNLSWVAETLARREAKNKHLGNATEYEDLYQVAMWGVCAAVFDWKPDGGKAMHSYAWDRAYAYIGHYMRDKSRLIKIPRSIQSLYYNYLDYISKNPEVSREQLLEKLNCNDDELKKAQRVGVSTPFQLYSETLNPDMDRPADPEVTSSKKNALMYIAELLTDEEMQICLGYFEGCLKKQAMMERAENLIYNVRRKLEDSGITLETLNE